MPALVELLTCCLYWRGTSGKRSPQARIQDRAGHQYRAVGWPDQSGFARRFKAHYGLSATTYRKRFATGAAHLHLPAGVAS